MQNDLISRSRLIAELEAFKISLRDIVFGWVIDRVIELIRQQPTAEGRAQVRWYRPGPCPLTPEQFEAIYEDEEEVVP